MKIAILKDVNMKKQYDAIGTFIRGNILPLSLQIISVVVLLANLWLASKLAPLATSIDRVQAQVVEIQRDNANDALLIPRFYQLEQHTKDIDNALSRIESKVDRIMERTVTTTTNTKTTFSKP
jgi:hypothetical protein